MKGKPPTLRARTAARRERCHGPATLLTGDALQTLQALPAGTVDCVVTSPPYWRLRDYATGSWTGGAPDCPHPATATTERDGHRRCARCEARWSDAQVGREATLNEYTDHLRRVFAELHRVLVPAGTVWLNLGDSYAANSDGYPNSRPGQYRQPAYRPRAGLPDKNLLGLPWKVALALQADGWLIRNAIIWHKTNAAPFPVRDRLANRHETVFLLTKQEHHYLDRTPREPGTSTTDAEPLGKTAGGSGDVWSIPVTPRRRPHHPATSPLQIPLRCIQLGSPPGGLVCDPFSGTGTTGLAALSLGRAYLGIDLNPAYTELAASRLNTVSTTHSSRAGQAPAQGEAR
ncbi:site-specific DNA-methyltransferase [Streptomyces sp. DSM 44917]|uniref:Methyltransferase n=1 Tax=Streptomyces boetiae TaxID=3075541 RepID=A0ABU2L6L5_9ACTN|nr:site-specific DNA-methyltransferase [Streptomyces sp. DSM 44917]MDT0307210.1 site-specific DNA-methyltransferase [Streptomyces sp. DSM 44917]